MPKPKHDFPTEIPFKKPDPSDMCEPGYHVVQGHQRHCASGVVTWVDTHLRQNRGKSTTGLLKENIHYLYWNSDKKYPNLPLIPEYRLDKHKYDSAIQFWLEYWRSEGVEFPSDLDPLLIKAIIAVESSFDSSAKTGDPKSTATGLMQITNQTMRLLGGSANADQWVEVKKHLVQMRESDKLDPLVSIAAGIRWLGHKYSQIPKRYPKNARSTVVGYHSFDEAGELYADKVFDIYNPIKGKK